MKKKLVFKTAIVFSVLCFAACNDDNKDFYGDVCVVDYAPIAIRLDVVNKEGKSLISEKEVNGIPFDSITATYNEGVMRLCDSSEKFTRESDVEWLGFVKAKTVYKYENGQNVAKDLLYIGAFDPLDKCLDRKIAINWGDNVVDTLAYTNLIHWNEKKREFECTHYYYLNGEKIENPSNYVEGLITIVK